MLRRALGFFSGRGFSGAVAACTPRAPVLITRPVAAAAKGASKRQQGAAVGSKRAKQTATVKVRKSKSQVPCELQSDAETKAYWSSVLQKCTKPICLELRKTLDLTHPLGIRSLKPVKPPKGAIKGAKKRPAKGTKRPSVACFEEFKDYKRRYPTFLVLIRIGEFYEAAGVDAVVLVQHANLNASAPGSGIAKAGMRVGQLHSKLDLLVKQLGFSVVVVEEEADYNYGQKRKQRKKRVLGGIVTPASPNYVHGLVAAGKDMPIDKPCPHVGVAMDKSGFIYMSMDLDSMTITIQDGLSEEALYASLNAQRFAPPLFIHNSMYTPKANRESSSSPRRKWQRRMQHLARFEGVPSSRLYDAGCPKAGFEQEVRRALGLDVTTPIAITSDVVRPFDTPRPPYMSTVMQLGLLHTPGMPNLLDSCLPAQAPLQSRAWMRRLLMLPPPAPVAASIHQACALLSELEDVPLPDYDTTLTPTKIQVCVEKAQGTEVFFRQLAPLLTAVRNTLRPGEGHEPLARFAQLVLPAVERESGIALPAEHLARVCREAVEGIWATVPRSARSSSGSSSSSSGSGPGGDAAVRKQAGGGGPVKGYGTDMVLYNKMKAASMGVDVVHKLAAKLEKFHGRVHDSLIQQEVDKVAACKQRVLAELRAAYDPIRETCPTDRDSEKPRCHYDATNDTVWIAIPPRSSMSSTRAKGLWKQLHHPKDRNGVVMEKTKGGVGILSTGPLDAALGEYRLAARAANLAATAQLRALARRLEPHTAALTGACSFAVVAMALVQHVEESGRRRGWSLPLVGAPALPAPTATVAGSSGAVAGTAGAAAAVHAAVAASSWVLAPSITASSSLLAQSVPFTVKGMWPFWLDGRDPEVVRNSFSLDAMVLLTGPNMAGKSTVLRSLCSVALLANCGLMVPARSATVPFVDAFMLRNFSGDSAVDGKSSFAVEMDEMRYVLEDVTSQSLVLIDELGKGTEVFAGSALSGAVIERLAASGCRGIFATHLHLLHEMDLDAQGVERWRMEVVERAPHEVGELAEYGLTLLRPTWRVAPGICTESLALEAALKCNVSTSIVLRAAQLVQQLPDYARLARPSQAAQGLPCAATGAGPDATSRLQDVHIPALATAAVASAGHSSHPPPASSAPLGRAAGRGVQSELLPAAATLPAPHECAQAAAVETQSVQAQPSAPQAAQPQAAGTPNKQQRARTAHSAALAQQQTAKAPSQQTHGLPSPPAQQRGQLVASTAAQQAAERQPTMPHTAQQTSKPTASEQSQPTAEQSQPTALEQGPPITPSAPNSSSTSGQASQRPIRPPRRVRPSLPPVRRLPPSAGSARPVPEVATAEPATASPSAATSTAAVAPQAAPLQTGTPLSPAATLGTPISARLQPASSKQLPPVPPQQLSLRRIQQALHSRRVANRADAQSSLQSHPLSWSGTAAQQAAQQQQSQQVQQETQHVPAQQPNAAPMPQQQQQQQQAPQQVQQHQQQGQQMKQPQPPQEQEAPQDVQEQQQSTLPQLQQQEAAQQVPQQQEHQQQQQANQHLQQENPHQQQEHPHQQLENQQQQQQQQQQAQQRDPSSQSRARMPAWVSPRKEGGQWPDRTIEQAGAVLREVVADSLRQRAEDAGSDGGGAAQAAVIDPAALPVLLVMEGYVPAPMHMHKACVYICRWQDKHFYAGETTKIRDRFKRHKQRRGKQSMEMAYVCLRDIQWAEALEKQIIRRLKAHKFFMLSDTDGREGGTASG